MKLLFSGHALQCLAQFEKLGIAADIHPLLTALRQAGGADGNIAAAALRSTDERLRADKSVSVGFVLAALMWPRLDSLWRRNTGAGMKPAAALTQAVNELRDLEKGWGVPQRFCATMREIWQLQPQFEHRRGARPHRLLAQQRFRAAYDFLLLRAETGNADAELAQWWTAFQHADEETRRTMSAQQEGGRAGAEKRKRRRKPRKKKEAGHEAV